VQGKNNWYYAYGKADGKYSLMRYDGTNSIWNGYEAFNSISSNNIHPGNDYDAIKIGSGYDHNFVLNKSGNVVDLAATAFSPVSGIQMDVYTDQPGMQFYTGNFMSGNDIGISNKPYKRRSAFSLETQHFPDSPNKPNFPSITLNPGDTYRHTCIYKFSVKK